MHKQPPAKGQDPKLAKLGQTGFALLQKLLSDEYTYLTPLIYGFEGSVSSEIDTIGTDGKTAYFNADWLIRNMADREQGFSSLKSAYLHMMAHCILGHVWQKPEGGKAMWNAACDLVAEALVRQITGTSDHTARSIRQEVLLSKLALITPEALVRLCRGSPKQRKQLGRLALPLQRDNHKYWSRSSNSRSSPSDASTAEQFWKDMMQMAYGMLPDQVSEHIRQAMGLSNFGQSITAAEENESDYRRILRKYAQIREQKQEDYDSIDFGWYTLGLEMYGNIPLIEYPESAELPNVDDIVIAVDVSGSCSGQIASRFLRETCNMIRDMSIGCAEVNIRILECDDTIQREIVIHRADDIPDLSVRKITGFGGTDFCPVFEHIAKLRRDGAMSKVRCLLYLSDGWGTFPDSPPDYDTIFILTKDSKEYRSNIPAWVHPVYLTERDLKEKVK